ncbi:MAG: NAD(P)H-dependent oxidoreductase subunit E [Evtepia sp.]
MLRQYQDDSTSLIMILQQAQAIYGYLPQEVIYHVAERTGNSPAKVMGVATFYSYFPPQAHGDLSDHAVRRHGLPRQRL